jgi:hypothetical protein
LRLAQDVRIQFKPFFLSHLKHVDVLQDGFSLSLGAVGAVVSRFVFCCITQPTRRCYFSPSHQSVYISITSAPYHTYPASFTRREQIAIPLHHVCQQTIPLPPDSIYKRHRLTTSSTSKHHPDTVNRYQFLLKYKSGKPSYFITPNSMTPNDSKISATRRTQRS